MTNYFALFWHIRRARKAYYTVERAHNDIDAGADMIDIIRPEVAAARKRLKHSTDRIQEIREKPLPLWLIKTVMGSITFLKYGLFVFVLVQGCVLLLGFF